MNSVGFDPAASRQQFIDLLVSQIQYQDPLEPVSQDDITSQLAQFSTVEGVNELNLQFAELLRTQTLFSGVQMLGQQVEYLSPQSGTIETGTIETSRVSDGKLELTVNGEPVGTSAIHAVIKN